MDRDCRVEPGNDMRGAHAETRHPRRDLRAGREARHRDRALAGGAGERGADQDRRLRRLRHRSAHPERALAEAAALAVHARPRDRRRHRREGRGARRGFHGKPIVIGSKIMIPPLMPCGRCHYCIHYPENANKCLTPVYYGRYLGFDKPPHLWGGWAEYVYVDLDMLPGTKIYKLPDDMPLRLGALAEPLTSCIRAFNRATRAGGFRWGDTVVVQGSGPIGILAVAAAQEIGAGRVICVGAPEAPRLKLARKFGAEATVDIEAVTSPAERIARVREIVGGFGADVVMDCSGHPSAGPEGIEMLRDGGTYVEMGQFTDAGTIETSWHRICAKDLNVLGSWAFTGNDLPLGVEMLYRARDKYPWLEMQTLYPFSEEGIGQAVADAMAMKTVKSTIMPWPELTE